MRQSGRDLFKEVELPARSPMDFYTLIAVVIAALLAAIILLLIVPRK